MAVCAGNGIPDSKGWEAPSDASRSGRYHKTLLNNDLPPLIADYLIDTVILLDCIDEILPSARYIGSPEDNEDVRCMYVAVTRAKNTLYMIVPKIVLKYGKA